MGHDELVSVLAELGGDIEALANSGWTPLLLAVRGSSHLLIINDLKVVIELQVLTLCSPPLSSVFSPLQANRGHAACVRALLLAGADITAKDRQQRAALAWSCHQGHAGCVEVLLAAGAPPGRVY
jgi:ankyrin repeat protein